jgi:iron-sulfur cluster assembly protein
MSIHVTEAAARHIQRTIDKRGSGIGLRLAVKTSGCSGLSYVMAVADEVGEADALFETQGVKVLVDSKSLTLLDGVEVDFVREGLNEGFKFRNPNAKGTCGCGESFAV